MAKVFFCSSSQLVFFFNAVTAHFRCSVVNLVTFRSNLGAFEKNLKNQSKKPITKKIESKNSLSKNPKKIYKKNPKIPKYIFKMSKGGY